MSLAAQIDEALKNAMRAREAEKLSVLRMLKSAVKYVAIEKHGADGVATDEEVLAVVRKEIKKRQDAIEGYEKAGRAESAAAEKSEMEFLQTYLPAGLTEAELETLVDAAIAEAGATSKAQMGAVMKIAGAKAAGRADGKVLSGIVQRKLS